jgi:hypothetical protein
MSSIFFNGTVKVMLCVNNPSLASVITFRMQPRQGWGQQEPRDYRQRGKQFLYVDHRYPPLVRKNKS